ncbi:MAG TPA: hypothetical protein VMG60_15200 [Burkholderiaceae bacterium]|nr:hypothetical protein [Burkholderiaceae bacterium]
MTLMRVSIRARGIAVSLSLALAACTGNNLTSVGGALSGLNPGASVTLQNNGDDNLTLTENGAFHFPTVVPGGSTYSITVLTQPAGQTCAVADGSGTLDAQGDPVDNVAVTCTTTSSLGGTISGLAPGTSVTLANGTTPLPVDVNGAFAFPGTLPVGTAYDVTVAVQPAGQTCVVRNGSGTIAAGGSMTMLVTCS